jgi:hypothetical protein
MLDLPTNKVHIQNVERQNFEYQTSTITKRGQLQNVESQNVDSAKMHRKLLFYIVSPCKMNF